MRMSPVGLNNIVSNETKIFLQYRPLSILRMLISCVRSFSAHNFRFLLPSSLRQPEARSVGLHVLFVGNRMKLIVWVYGEEESQSPEYEEDEGFI